jgi:hypothetical protein
VPPRAVTAIGLAILANRPHGLRINRSVDTKSRAAPREFLTSGRLGFYLRVLEEGEVGAGDVLERPSLGVELSDRAERGMRGDRLLR